MMLAVVLAATVYDVGGWSEDTTILLELECSTNTQEDTANITELTDRKRNFTLKRDCFTRFLSVGFLL